MSIEIRGGSQATRQIHAMIPPEFPSERLLVMEAFAPGGNSSSLPSHKHDVHTPPAELDFEEIYC